MIPPARKSKGGYKLVKKSDSWFMKFLNFLMFWNDSFMTSYWTTIGRTVYVPTRAVSSNYGTEEWKKFYHRILNHEETHVAQGEAYTFPIFFILYLGPSFWKLPAIPVVWILCLFFTFWLPATIVTAVFVLLFPLTAGLAYWRWYFEREAYLPEVLSKYRRSGRAYAQKRIDRISNNLATDYFFTWPKGWMQKWFDKQLARADQDPNFNGVVSS